MDGNFSLEVAPNSILIVSFIGYKEQQIPVNSQKTVTIKLTEDSQALEEVVVVGYGTQKKSTCLVLLHPLMSVKWQKAAR